MSSKIACKVPMSVFLSWLKVSCKYRDGWECDQGDGIGVWPDEVSNEYGESWEYGGGNGNRVWFDTVVYVYCLIWKNLIHQYHIVPYQHLTKYSWCTVVL